MSKPILCLGCRNFDLVILVGNGVRVVEECYYPANEHKSGTATSCEEYEPKESANKPAEE